MSRYQDFVIKDGKFIGKFEEMYQKCDNPWHQKDIKSSYARYATIASINRYSIHKAVEVGCGLGYTTSFLKKNALNLDIVGIDISPSAIYKARKEFTDIHFEIGTALDVAKNSVDGTECLIFAEIMWYILEDIDKIIKNINHNYKGKYIIINQTFYRGQQKYGREYFTSVDEMIEYLGWKCVSKIVADSDAEESIATHCVFCV